MIKEWHTEFKILNLKERNFLNMLNNNLSNIESSYIKGGPWIKNFSFLNSLYTWAITNHAPIKEYQFIFFPREEFSCLYRVYPIKTRCHILYDCRRFNKYWNPRRDMLWNTLDTNIFLFLLSIFLDFIFLFFWISFFFLLMMKRHMILQLHDRSHDVTS